MQAGDETEMICPRCKRDVVETVNVRGETGCLHCHLDRVWDYMEGTRRMMKPQMDRLYIGKPQEDGSEREKIKIPIAKFLGDDK